METIVLLTILLTLMGVKQINAYEASSGQHDDSRIVIDEVIGVLDRSYFKLWYTASNCTQFCIFPFVWYLEAFIDWQKLIAMSKVAGVSSVTIC